MSKIKGNDPQVIKAQAGQAHQIVIMDNIGFWGVSQQDFASQLQELNGEDVEVLISSNGGSVQHGIAIYNMLLNYKGRVTTVNASTAASIASVIAMAGDVRAVAHNSSTMIHKPSAEVQVSTDNIEEIQSLMAHFDEVVVESYSRTGQDKDEIRALLSNGDKWMSASEALELGFATEIRQGLEAVAESDVSIFNNVPDFVTNKFDTNLIDGQKIALPETLSAEHKTLIGDLMALGKQFFNPSAVEPENINQGGNSPAIEEEVTMTDQTIALADHEAAIAQATATATAKAQQDATDRLVDINALDSAAGKDKLVAKLSANAALTVEQVDDILQAAPVAKAATPIVDELDGLDLDADDDGKELSPVAQYRKNIGKGDK